MQAMPYLQTILFIALEEVYGTRQWYPKRREWTLHALYGADGDDTLTGNLDGDVLDGGNGMNLADYSARTQNLTVGFCIIEKYLPNWYNTYSKYSGYPRKHSTDQWW